ncbi:ABC transporter permease [Prosthecomicrobium pneumaticum]|uniref:Ribose transport system permease protein n=1 Tax=Prosthecomicrobium pneumaticum TaxID=81895 RepID=A0A7W9CSQ9_9HYPH|nr:ABC transporter permease [Prosthecomicrobium pneumaticum]MBB5751205.1 ribose transport system permease protein [Prosthecomicrobium pneumaticum]
MAVATVSSPKPSRRLPLELIGGWEVGLILFMALLYLVGVFINPVFFGKADALVSVLRDTARVGIMAVGMTFVIVNKDLDLSVGSTVGLVATVFSICFARSHYDLGIVPSILAAVAFGVAVGLVNGFLVTTLRVPSFITTLTMLFIGRGLVLGLTGGKTISYSDKATSDGGWFFALGANNGFGFNNQILVFALVALVGVFALAKTRWGYETYATGGNEMAASYAGIPTKRVRIRAYVLSALCATLAGLLNVAQDKGVTSQYGQGAELIVIAAVIVGGASILGGRGRVLGGALGAMLVTLIDKVLREGIPMTRIVKVGDVEMQVQGMAQLPPGAVPAFLGIILLLAVLIEPWIIRRQVFPRLLARLRGRPLPPLIEVGGVAIEGAQTKGSTASDKALRARGLGKFLARRDAAAIMLTIVLWAVGLYLRPDFWGSIDNSFNLLLSFTEVGLLSIGLTYVIANGDIDLSVGSVLALSGATAAFLMKQLGFDPWSAVFIALAAGAAAGFVNALLTVRFGLPAFVATLGMFYMARGIGAWMVAGRQLSGFSENFNLLGRKLIEVLRYFGIAPEPGSLAYEIAAALSVQTIFMLLVALVAGIVLAKTPFGQMVYATGGNRRAAEYAGINTNRVRFLSLVFSALCAAAAGVIYIAFLRSFNPSAGQLRELDAIAAVIIGGGSIFGGYGTVIGALAGAAVIALIRALLSLQVLLPDGSSFVMPQHWVNVFIGLILITAVLGDIWFRQGDLVGSIRRRFARRSTPAKGSAHA